MPTGIHNPFVKRVNKEKKITSFEIGGLDTDIPKTIPPKVHLDGGRYVITISNTDSVPGAIDRLLTLVYAVAKTHEKTLNTNGIYVGIKPLNTDERALTDKHRQLTVYSPEHPNSHPEEAIYRRIAYTLLGIPLKKTYEQLNVEIYERSIG